ncbi:MAG: DNA methyltransferase [Planctomycetota bacterium]
MSLPVHRWIRFSAGFSAAWAESVIADSAQRGPTRVLDTFAGSGTTLIAAENVGVESCGIEAHPFVSRIARAKVARRSDPETYREFVRRIRLSAAQRNPDLVHYPPLIRKCYCDATLAQLDVLRQAVEDLSDGSPAAELSWFTLVGILRKVSHVNTAQWQYVLPRKKKRRPLQPFPAFDGLSRIIYDDMVHANQLTGPHARFIEGDARICTGVPQDFATLVVTSPPYPNNFDYADATRLEMSFMGEISGWGDLHAAVRRHLVCSCSQHVPEKAVDLDAVLSRAELDPIRASLRSVCGELAKVRLTKGGRKTYHLMVACYFLDLAQVWRTLRSVCASPCRVCFVIGDSAPYGVYVPVMDWLGELALATGFKGCRFERTRDRNVKWKNRKHRVPLCEGRLWVDG